MKAYFMKLGDALSQLGNVLIFGGDPNYSISGDAYRFKRTWLMRFIDKIFGQGHCEAAHFNDIEKARQLLKSIGESA